MPVVSVSVTENLKFHSEEKFHLSNTGFRHFVIDGSQQAKL
jgi:hypothetical protein